MRKILEGHVSRLKFWAETLLAASRKEIVMPNYSEYEAMLEEREKELEKEYGKVDLTINS